MQEKADGRYMLGHGDARLVVDVGTESGSNVARLLVDGDVVDEGRAWRVGALKLRHEDLTVAVSWWWTGRVRSCDLIEKSEGGGPGNRPHRTMFEPPRDTRAYRLLADAAAASRPVRVPTRRRRRQQGAGVDPGISALLAALLPHVDLSWIPVPDVDIDKPGWWPEFSL